MAKNNPVEISLVIPVFNEAAILPELVARLNTVCSEFEKSYEIIFVDDGSDDGSFEALKKLKQQDPHLRLLKFTRNFGQQAAVLAGFRLSLGDIVIQTPLVKNGGHSLRGRVQLPACPPGEFG